MITDYVFFLRDHTPEVVKQKLGSPFVWSETKYLLAG